MSENIKLPPDELVRRINGITELLAKPGLSVFQRRLLHDDRKDLQAALKKQQEPQP